MTHFVHRFYSSDTISFSKKYLKVKSYIHLSGAFSTLLSNWISFLYLGLTGSAATEIRCICGTSLIPFRSVVQPTKTWILRCQVCLPPKVKCLQEHKEHHIWVAFTTRPAEIILQTRERSSSASHFSHFSHTAGVQCTMNLNPVLSCRQLQLSLSLLHILIIWRIEIKINRQHWLLVSVDVGDLSRINIRCCTTKDSQPPATQHPPPAHFNPWKTSFCLSNVLSCEVN